MKLTIQDLEELANQIANENQSRRDKLTRMIRAYCKIIHAREPGKFTRRACHFSDEVGNCDGSYPPDQEYSDRTGPRSIEIINLSSEDVPTESGFYYSYRTVPSDPGLYVTPTGALLGGD